MKRPLLVGLMMLLLAAPLQAKAASPEGDQNLPPSRVDMPDKSQESDCDCCQKCQAARRPMHGNEETSNQPKNGCENCCDRCGRKLPTAPHDSPPDIMEKPGKS